MLIFLVESFVHMYYFFSILKSKVKKSLNLLRVSNKNSFLSNFLAKMVIRAKVRCIYANKQEYPCISTTYFKIYDNTRCMYF